MAKYLAKQIIVMCCGKVVEEGDSEDLFSAPAHAYTATLISAIPAQDIETRFREILLPGTVPNPSDLPPCCAFYTRCPRNKAELRYREGPVVLPLSASGRAACHLLKSVPKTVKN